MPGQARRPSVFPQRRAPAASGVAGGVRLPGRSGCHDGGTSRRASRASTLSGYPTAAFPTCWSSEAPLALGPASKVSRRLRCPSWLDVVPPTLAPGAVRIRYPPHANWLVAIRLSGGTGPCLEPQLPVHRRPPGLRAGSRRRTTPTWLEGLVGRRRPAGVAEHTAGGTTGAGGLPRGIRTRDRHRARRWLLLGCCVVRSSPHRLVDRSGRWPTDQGRRSGPRHVRLRRRAVQVRLRRLPPTRRIPPTAPPRLRGRPPSTELFELYPHQSCRRFSAAAPTKAGIARVLRSFEVTRACASLDTTAVRR